MSEKCHSFKVSVITIFVRNPVACCSSIIQIQHGSNRINSQSINMELVHPEHSVGNKEIRHLILAIIKHLGSPVRMLSLAWIRIFIDTAAIKISKSMGIPWKMSRNPVKNNANSLAVHIIHKIHEILRSSIS